MHQKFAAFFSLLISISFVIGFIFAFSSSAASAKESEPPVFPTTFQASLASQPSSVSATPLNVLVHAVGADPQVLDPALAYDAANGEVLMQIYETLVELNREKTDEFIPLLSTGWTISPDARSYTFNIRTGAKFHDGSTLTASDVAYSFQRGILQAGTFTGQWLLTEPLLGMGITDVCNLLDPSVCNDRAELQAYQTANSSQVAGVCNSVKSKIVADDTAGTVTFYLTNAWAPFLNTLAGTWGAVIEREWAVQQGAWDGDCSTWHNYYAATNSTSPLRNFTNGTGPFKLDHWIPGVELVLSRHNSYWNTVPLWPGGPFGPAAFETVRRTVVADSAVRAQLLLDGNADLIHSVPTFSSDFDDATLFHYSQPDGITPTLVNPAGVLKKFTGGLTTSATDAFFTYDIVTGGPRNYVGSGTWDGHGIPANFFSDLNVRKAFNYAFDWDAYKNAIYGGTGLQRTGPIIKPLPGFDESQSVYSFNPTLAKQHLDSAWGGLVATHGFSLTVAYNNDNLARQKIAEILKTNIEDLDTRFHIKVVGLSTSNFNADQVNSRLPIFITGWNQDIPHPHNWVVPYLDGIYAVRQKMPTAMQSTYHTMIYNCLALVGDTARECYEDIQEQTYQDAVDIFLVQALQRTYVSANVQGYYLNPGRQGPRYYDLHKNPLPETVTVEPTVEQTLNFTPTLGVTATASIPAGSVTQEIQIVALPEIKTFAGPSEFMLGGVNFDLQAYLPDGTLIPDMVFENPITITLAYGAGAFTPEQEAGLVLLYWDGANWVDAASGPYVRDLVGHSLQVPILHLSTFGLAEPSELIYLPAIRH